MNLKSFIIKTQTGIHTLTNIEIHKKLIYTTDAYTESNRKSALAYLGYLDNPQYSIEDNFRKVYQHQLVSRRGSTKLELIMLLNSPEEGVSLLDKVWTDLANPYNKQRMVDLTVA